MTKVSVSEAGARLADLVAAALHGEQVIIEADAHQVQLVPLDRTVKRRVFGSARGQIQMAEDFDEPLQDFEAYAP